MAYKFTTTLNKLRVNKALEMCQHEQINAFDLADKLNIRTDIARGILRYMCQHKMIYVSEYKIFGKAWTRYYMAGNKPSVEIDDYKESYYMTAKQKQKSRKKDIESASKKPRPDIASAWMFNPC